MSGWFSKASNVFRRTVPEIEQSFELSCECGQLHQGLRRSRHQRIVCRECGMTRFVLPRDVYPAPRGPRRTVIAEPIPLPVLAPVDEPEPLPKLAREIEFEPEVAELPVAVADRPARRPKPAAAAAPQEKAPEFLVVVPRKRFWTPFRFVTLGISLCLVALMIVLVLKQRRDYATKVLRTVGDEVAVLVDARDWSAAKDRYGAAVRAVGILSRKDANARKFRQGLQETTALTDLNSGSLLDVLEDAEQWADDPGSWQSAFNVRYRDHWLVFEAPIVVVDRDGTTEREMEFPAPIGSHDRSVVVRADLDAFRELPKNDSDRPVIFAAQLESCVLSEDGRKWIVALRRKSGFLWASLKTYRGLGFQFDKAHPRADVQALLARQAELLELDPEKAGAELTEETSASSAESLPMTVQ